jgi:hypothetical protein
MNRISHQTSSRLSAVAGSAILVSIGVFGGIGSALATDLDIATTVTTAPAIDPTEVPLPPRPRVNLGAYASYIVTLDPYNENSGETFLPVYFRATTTVVNVGEGESPVAGQVAAFDFAGAVLPFSDCTVTTTPANATSTIECKTNFALVSNGPNAPPFTVTVKAPTAGQRIKFISETRWFEGEYPHHCGAAPGGNFPVVAPPCLETEGPKPPIYFDLINPVTNPTIAETVLPFATGGTVTTGTGAATCDNPWVVSVRVPQAATVSLNSATTPDTLDIATCSSGNCQFFAKVKIPQATFLATNPLVTTLRRDRCTIEGRGIIGKALQILEESIYYRGDEQSAFAKVYSCRITGGPVTGQPCIASRGIYTIFNLPNVPDKLKYLGDHFWNVYSTENGKWGAP